MYSLYSYTLYCTIDFIIQYILTLSCVQCVICPVLRKWGCSSCVCVAWLECVSGGKLDVPLPL